MTGLPSPIVHRPRGTLPVLLSVPHSGRDYPDWLIADCRGGREALETLEDPLVDRLVWRAMGRGVGAVVARAPRAAIDCNRSEDELDPTVIEGASCRQMSARTRGGLGLVPSRTQRHGYLWRRSIGRAELERRIAEAYRPYHDAIDREIALLLARFGAALLIDCHSMPPPPPGIAPIVFGDCHGRTAERWLVNEALSIARAQGFEAGLNDPFAGGHIVARHGNPRRGVQAIQIEIDRRCYLDELGEPAAGFDDVARLVDCLVGELGSALLDRAAPIAAE